MKFIRNYFRLFLLALTIVFCTNSNAQITGFGLTTDTAVHNIGIGFVVGASINALQDSTSAIIRIRYNNTLVAVDPTNTALPSCMSYSINGTNDTVTIFINNLSLCSAEINPSVSVGIGFKFLCPDSCFKDLPNGIKNAQFSATVTDNHAQTFTSTCTAKGKLQNDVTLSQSIISYNSVNAEIIYEVRYRNPNCYKIKNPVFNVTLSDTSAYIVPQPYGYDHVYTVNASGGSFNISPNIPSLEMGMVNDIYFRYKVKLRCNTALGSTISSTVKLLGENCGQDSSVIKSTGLLAYTVPSLVSIIPSIHVMLDGFFCAITNNGNTPLNIEVTSVLPPIHLTSITHHASYTSAVAGVRYFDCGGTPFPSATTEYPMSGGIDAGNNNVPLPNTKSFLYKIYDLPPGEQIFLYTNYDTSSSCNGPASAPPYINNLHIVYNCAIQQNVCSTCGDGPYVVDTFSVITKNPKIYCESTTDILDYKGIGDTINLCYNIRNYGDNALNNGIYTVPLPLGIHALPLTATFANFSSSPTTSMSGNSIVFNLPQLPVGNSTYQICFKAVIVAGVTAGEHLVTNTISGTNPVYSNNVCISKININAVSAISITKKVKGSLDAGYSTNGQGIPGSMVKYQLTLYNSGTTPINRIEVIDRIPTIGNVKILGNPGALLTNQFNMVMQSVPTSSTYTTRYTKLQNICTGWPMTASNCTAFTSSSWLSTMPTPESLVKGVKFTFDTLFQIAPSSSYTFEFQTTIPTSALNNQTDCNTAGFYAIPIGATTVFASESPEACIKVKIPLPPCDTNASANFHISVNSEVNNYNITAIPNNTYPNTAHQWFVLSSPNPTGGPYTPVYSSTAATLTYGPLQYNVYYTVIHKIKTDCAEDCSSVIQYQSNNGANCCLANFYWPGGAGTEPHPLSAAFELGATPFAPNQYTINIYPTYTYGANISHQWYVLRSHFNTGGPYFPVTQGSGPTFSYAPADDSWYYFVIHKIKSDCGEACYGQSICRNCKGVTPCEMCGVIDCSLLDNYWPKCQPPINLKGDCEKGGVLSWQPVAAAGGYQIEMSLNDPECCETKYEQIGFHFGLDQNSIHLNTLDLPKYDCIRWRVRSKCDNGYSDWTDWTCYYCETFIPFPKMAAKASSNVKEINVSPQVIPNPNNGEMKLSMKVEGPLEISVMVFNAQAVLVKSVAKNKYPDGNFLTNLNMGSNTAKGVYLFVFDTNYGTFNKKVIIQ